MSLPVACASRRDDYDRESPVQWRERSGGGGEWVHTGGPAMHRAVPQPSHPLARAL